MPTIHTSGTMFHSRKLSFTDILAALCIIANAAKGVSALQLSRDLDVQAKNVGTHYVITAIAVDTSKSDRVLKGFEEIRMRKECSNKNHLQCVTRSICWPFECRLEKRQRNNGLLLFEL